MRVDFCDLCTGSTWVIWSCFHCYATDVPQLHTSWFTW